MKGPAYLWPDHVHVENSRGKAFVEILANLMKHVMVLIHQ